MKKENYSIIIPADYHDSSKDVIPLFCDVCQFRLMSLDDEDAYKKFQCCSMCADTWAYSNKDEWKKGWRPSNEQVEKSIQRRSIVNRHIRFE